MPIFTPGRRWQPAFSPFKKESLGNRLLENIEYAIKSPLFGCRMCGNCLLQETAFICPMECPEYDFILVISLTQVPNPEFKNEKPKPERRHPKQARPKHRIPGPRDS